MQRRIWLFLWYCYVVSNMTQGSRYEILFLIESAELCNVNGTSNTTLSVEEMEIFDDPARDFETENASVYPNVLTFCSSYGYNMNDLESLLPNLTNTLAIVFPSEDMSNESPIVITLTELTDTHKIPLILPNVSPLIDGAGTLVPGMYTNRDISKAIHSTVNNLGWTYVQAVVQGSDYYKGILTSLKGTSHISYVCVLSEYTIYSNSSEEDMGRIIQYLGTEPETRGTILLMDDTLLRKFITVWNRSRTEDDDIVYMAIYSSSTTLRNLRTEMLGWLVMPVSKFIHHGYEVSNNRTEGLDSRADYMYKLTLFIWQSIYSLNVSLCNDSTDQHSIFCARERILDYLRVCCETIPVQNVQLQNNTSNIVTIGEINATNFDWLEDPKFYNYEGTLRRLIPKSTNEPFRDVCRQSVKFKTMTSEAADIYVIGILPIHHRKRSADGCGRLISSIAVLTEVLVYAVDYINNNPDVLPELQLGYIILDSCDDVDRIIYQLDKIYAEKAMLDIIGSVGFLTSSNNIKLGPYLKARDLLAVSIRDTSSTLSDKIQYPYFYRMVPTNGDQAKAIVAILEQLSLTDIGIVYSDDAFGSDLTSVVLQSLNGTSVNVRFVLRLEDTYISDENTMAYLVNKFIVENKDTIQAVVTLSKASYTKVLVETVQSLHVSDILWIGCDEWPLLLDSVSVNDVAPYIDGAIFVTFTSGKSKSVEQYMDSLTFDKFETNPFLREYVEQKFDCSLSDQSGSSNCSNITNIDMSSVYGELLLVNSVISVAHGTDSLIRKYCPHNNHCHEAKTRMSELPDIMYNSNITGMYNTTIQFDSKGNGRNQFDIFTVRAKNVTGEMETSVIQVGTWREGDLVMNKTLLNVPTSITEMTRCNNGNKCASVPLDLVGLQYGYFPGDVMIYVFLEIFEKDAQSDACSDKIRPDIFQTMMGIIWSLEQINKNDGILQGVKLGVAIFKVCGTKSTQVTVKGTLKPSFILPPKPLSPFQVPPLGIVGGTTDEIASSMDAVRTINSEIPMIVSAPTSYFNNRSTHPRTFRTVLSASELMEFVLSLMQNLQWTYVHTIYDETSKELAEFLVQKGKENGACFATQNLINVNHDSITHSITQSIKDMLGMAGASAVIVMLQRPYLETFFKTAQQLGTAGRLVFVIPEEFEDIESLIKERETVALGMITLKRQVTPNNYFMSYLRSLTLRDNLNIPWIEEFWQDVHQCNLRYSTAYKTDCRSDLSLKSLDIRPSSNTVNNINGIYALSTALDDILHYCNTSIDQCISQNTSLFYQRLEEALDAVQTTPPGGQKFSFYNRNATTTLIVRNLELSPSGNARFVEVGTFLQKRLILDFKKISMYKEGIRQILPSKCLGVCKVCFSDNFLAEYDARVNFLSATGPPIRNDILNAIGVINMILMFLGGMTVAVTTFYLLKHARHKVFNLCVDAHACVILGSLLQVVSSFVYLFDTLPVICGIQHAIPGCVYSICITGLLIKLNKNACLRELIGTKQGKLARWDFLITYLPMTTSAPVIIYIAWILEDPPKAIWTVPEIQDIQSVDDVTITWTCHFNQMEYLVFSSFCWLNLVMCLVLSIFYNTRNSYQPEVSQVMWSSIVTSISVVISTCVLTLSHNHYVFRVLLTILLPLNGIVTLVINFMYQITELMKETNKEFLFSQMMFDKQTENMARIWIDRSREERNEHKEKPKKKRAVSQWKKSQKRARSILSQSLQNTEEEGARNFALDIEETNGV